MLKKSMKIVCLLLAIMMVFTLTSTVFATEKKEEKADDKKPSTTVTMNWDNATSNLNTKGDDGGAATSVGKMANAVLSVVQTVGMAVAVIMLVVLAIKYISAAPSDKAEIKKHAVVYVVGAVVLFGASGILQIVKNFATNIKA